jgi:hypothetical protein
MSWSQPFDVDFTFYEDLTGSTSAADFAHTLTKLDRHNFSNLQPQNIMAEDAVLTRLLNQWETLSIAVWECCTALPDLIPYIQDCVQVSLDSLSHFRLGEKVFPRIRGLTGGC